MASAQVWRKSAPSADSTPDASRSSSASRDHKRSRPKAARKSKGMLVPQIDVEKEKKQTQRATTNSTPGLPDSVARSGFFILPREIRDRIYSFCVETQEGVSVEWPMAARAFALQPQLLRVCQIIHDEASPLLYCQNNMAFYHPSDANMFVKAMSSQRWNGHISNLSLHIKAQDTRLWMPYLTSKDPFVRSLKSDYPALKHLNIRFRSNRWQTSASVEDNLKTWYEDSKLSELINGLTRTFHPTKEPQHPSSDPADDLSLDNDHATPDPSDPFAHKAYAAQTCSATAPSTINLTVACRIPPTHFFALTTTPAASNHLDATPTPSPRRTRPRRAQLRPAPDDPEPYRGFTPADFQTDGFCELQGPAGGPNTAATPFVSDRGVLLALEVHFAGPKGGVGAGEGLLPAMT